MAPQTGMPASRPLWVLVLGFAPMVPAVVFLLGSYVEPTVWLIRTSLHRLPAGAVTGGAGWQGETAGSSSYRVAMHSGFGGAIGYAFSLLWLPLLAVALCAPLLALCAHRVGVIGRRFVLAILALPLVAYAPSAIVGAWRVGRFTIPGASIPGAVGAGAVNAGAAGVAGAVRLACGLIAFGPACALAVPLYLAALRRRDRGGVPWPAFGLASAIAVLATIAVTLQEFTTPFMLTGGGPNRATTTPVLAMFATGFSQRSFGPAAAAATLLLLMLACLGIAATILIIVTGARLEVDRDQRCPDQPASWERSGLLAAMAMKFLVMTVLIISGYALWPWLGALFAGARPPDGSSSAAAMFAHTWLPPLVSTIIGVGTAAIAGYGIGALRPLGRRSELLLLPFAPFLFVGVGPLALRAYADGATASRLDSMLGLVPPTRLVIPALFIFTLLARGQAIRAELSRRDGHPMEWGRAYLRPALPMLGIVTATTWVVSAQDLLWPAISSSGRLITGPVRLYELLGGGGLRGPVPVSLAIPGWLLVVLLVAAVVAQLTYLNRVALRVGGAQEQGWENVGRDEATDPRHARDKVRLD